MSGIIGSINNSKTTGLVGALPAGTIAQQHNYHINGASSNFSAASNVETVIFDGNAQTGELHFPTIGRHSHFTVQIDCSIVSYAKNSATSDIQDLGVRVRYGIAANAITSEFGSNHAHRFQTATHFNTTAAFYSSDGNTITSVNNNGWNGHGFSHQYGQAINQPAGTPLWWKIEFAAASGAVYWNRHEASSTSNLGHTYIEIKEIIT